MPETCFILQIDVGEYSPVVHRLGFATKEAADQQLALLEPKLGLGKFRNDPENNRHRIAGEDGDLVVVLEHVRSARVVDEVAFHNLTKWMDLKRDRRLQRDVEIRVPQAAPAAEAP